MKKAAFFLVFCLVLLSIAFLPVWDSIYSSFEPKGRQGTFSQLNVSSIKGDYEVFIDNKSVGNVESAKNKQFVQIEPGRHSIKVVRKSDIVDFYYILERNLDFLPSTLVEISWEAGPTLESSSGVVKYFIQIINPKGAELYVLPFPQNSSVDLDSRKSEGNLFEILDTSTRTINISNGEGFESKSIPINLTDENTKKVLVNLKLILEIYLYKQPFI